MKTEQSKSLWHYNEETQEFIEEAHQTHSLTMTPGPADSGRVFYFNIIVSENDATNIRRAYPCTITVTGPVAVFTDVSFSLLWIDLDGQFQMTFSNPVNLQFLQDNFYNIFDFSFTNESSENSGSNEVIKVTKGYHLTDLSFNFTVKFVSD